MQEQILILDFGSQYTQLIARRIRELNVYCEIHPYHSIPSMGPEIKGVILSGSPCSVRDSNHPEPKLDVANLSIPLLGICYGAQWLAHTNGGVIQPSDHREYGRARLDNVTDNPLLKGVSNHQQVWMSHGDTIIQMPSNFNLICGTDSIDNAAFQVKGKDQYGIQFHPEVTHSECGLQILENFTRSICGCTANWTPANFVDETVEQIKATVGDNDQVILGLSGGVDSTVAAALIHKAIGDRLNAIFVNNGVLRKDEFAQVQHAYKDMGLNLHAVDASDLFLDALEGVKDPEQKRKIIGKLFIDVFQEEANKIDGAKWLAQGTIYPDVIESVSVKGPSATIKSHHNVGGLPEKMNLKLLEPLRALFKDEVRKIGKEVNAPADILGRHPFPGPGLAIRIIGAITRENVRILQEADAIYMQTLQKHGWYDKVWQAGCIFLPVQSVGVMGDERTYENVIAVRAVTSLDGMTADWVDFPYEVLAEISNKIINQVKGINRVVYDISSKPPATIEWE